MQSDNPPQPAEVEPVAAPATSTDAAPPVACHAFGPGLVVLNGKPVALKLRLIHLATADTPAMTLDAAIGTREEFAGFIKDLTELADRVWPESPIHLPKGFRR